MHAVLTLSSVLLLTLGGYVALGILRRRSGWSRRRDLQLAVLTAPVAGLGVGLGALHQAVGRTCFVGGPSWDYAVGVMLPLGMGLTVLGSLGLGIARVGVLHAMVARRGEPAPGSVQHICDRLAAAMGIASPQVLLCPSDRPLALTYGVWHPTVLLSTWMVEHLDSQELESVLAHELGHVSRRDYLVIWMATVLRDAFFYLPTSRAAYRLLQHEKELASDEIAVTATNRPLALASALAKVWQQILAGRTFDVAQAFINPGESIEARIERLLDAPRASTAHPRRSRLSIGLGIHAIAGLLSLTALNLAVLIAPVSCGLGPLLGRS